MSNLTLKIATRALLSAACFAALSNGPALAQTSISTRYTFTTLDYPGAPITYPLGVNAKGQIAGYYLDAAYLPHAFIYKKGKFTPIEYPGAALTTTSGINDRGDIAGVYFDALGFQHGFLMTMPGGCDDDGKSFACQPVFRSLDFPGAVQNRIPFEFGPGLGTAAAGLNNRRDVAGLYAAGIYSNGFIYSSGHYRPVDNPAADHSFAAGTRLFQINNLGAAVGAYTTQSAPAAPPINHGFVVEGDRFKSVYVTGSEMGGFGTQANGINDFGMVVGVYSDTMGFGHGLLWFNGQPYKLDYPGALFTEAHSINNLGVVTGAYTSDPTGNTIHGFVATPKF